MKDFLGQEVNIGDYVVASDSPYTSMKIYKVCKLCPKTVRVHNYRYIYPYQMLKVSDLSIVPQELKDLVIKKGDYDGY